MGNTLNREKKAALAMRDRQRGPSSAAARAGSGGSLSTASTQSHEPESPSAAAPARVAAMSNIIDREVKAAFEPVREYRPAPSSSVVAHDGTASEASTPRMAGQKPSSRTASTGARPTTGTSTAPTAASEWASRALVTRALATRAASMIGPEWSSQVSATVGTLTASTIGSGWSRTPSQMPSSSRSTSASTRSTLVLPESTTTTSASTRSRLTESEISRRLLSETTSGSETSRSWSGLESWRSARSTLSSESGGRASRSAGSASASTSASAKGDLDRKFTEQAVRWCGSLKDARVCVLGCRASEFVMRASNKIGPNGSLFVFDSSKDNVDRMDSIIETKSRARELQHKNIHTIHQDIAGFAKLPSMLPFYNLVTCFDILSAYQPRDHGRLVREWASYMLVGGRMVIECRSADDCSINLMLDLYREIVPENCKHLFRRSPDLNTLIRLAQEADLVIVKAWQTENFSPKSNLPADAADAELKDLAGPHWWIIEQYGVERVRQIWRRIWNSALNEDGVLVDGHWRSVVIATKLVNGTSRSGAESATSAGSFRSAGSTRSAESSRPTEPSLGSSLPRADGLSRDGPASKGRTGPRSRVDLSF